MYPFRRLALELLRNRNASLLSVGESHVTPIRIMPWDIDPFLELNNGRVLTLMDLGRFGAMQRLKGPKLLKENGWWGTVAGSVIRYRRRMTVFQKLELRTRLVGWDDRFTYYEQSFWKWEECCANSVIRIAVTGGKGIVPTSELAKAFDFPEESPPLPDWIATWIEAENARPWPPAI